MEVLKCVWMVELRFIRQERVISGDSASHFSELFAFHQLFLLGAH